MKRRSRKIGGEGGAQADEAVGMPIGSVPPTPASSVPALPADPFWVIDSSYDRARLLRSRVAIEKAVLFQSLVVERTLMGDLDLPSLFGATFDDRTGAAFWKLRLGGIIGPGQFVILLAAFLTAEGGTRSTHELALRATLTRDLSDAGVIPIATEVEHRSMITHVDPETGAQHLSEAAPSFHLDGKWFDPVPVVNWMAEREIYHRLMPISLQIFCGLHTPVHSSTRIEGHTPLSSQSPRPRGPKPETSERVEREMRAAISRGVDLGSMKTEEMKATFNAAASTCSTVRNRVLSELGREKNSE